MLHLVALKMLLVGEQLGQSPLSFATKNGDYDFVMKLVEKGADCSILDQVSIHHANKLLELTLTYFVERQHAVDISCSEWLFETLGLLH